MGVEEEVDEGPLEPGSVPFQAVESAARDLDSSVEVDDPEILCDLEMLFGCEIELPLPAGLVDDDVLGVVLFLSMVLIMSGSDLMTFTSSIVKPLESQNFF